MLVSMTGYGGLWADHRLLGTRTEPVSPLKTGITGNISISNISPGCAFPINGTGNVPAPSITTGLSSLRDHPRETRPETYSLTLSYRIDGFRGGLMRSLLHFLAKLASNRVVFLRMTVTVEPGKLTPVSIGMTTGID